MSPLQGEDTFWLTDPGVARETRLPRAAVFHALGVERWPLIYGFFPLPLPPP